MWRVPSPKDELPEETGDPLVRCHCGLEQQASMMADVRSLPPGLRRRMGVPDGATHVCDACLETVRREERAPSEEIYRALGAPAEVLDKVRAHEARRKELRGARV